MNLIDFLIIEKLIFNNLIISFFLYINIFQKFRLFIYQLSFFKFKQKKMKLTEQVIKNFRSAKTFRENTLRINSIDFSVQGDTLISSSDDESIVIFDCQTGV